MHNKLFEEGVDGGVDSFKEYAEDLGLDTDDFDDCLDSGEVVDKVAEDMEEGSDAGIRGTPAFIINGQLVSGAQSISKFQEIIDAKLEGKEIPDIKPKLKPKPKPKCNGCFDGNLCVDFGLRLENKEGVSVYCDTDSSLRSQKQEKVSCQNNYECLTNQCSNGKCIDLEKQLKETQGTLDKILNWFKGIFG